MASAGHSGGSSSGGGSLWGSAPSGGGAVQRPGPAGDGNNLPSLPGSFNVDVTSPEGLAKSLRDSATEGQDFFHGFGQALFGENNGSLLGGLPVIGNVGRFAEGVPGGVGDTLKNARDVVGGALEHVHVANSDDAKLQTQFDSIPDSFAGKAEAQAAIANDQGAAGHYMFKAYTDYVKEARATGDVKLGIWDTPELAGQEGSIADTLTQIMGGMGLAARPLQRAAAGTGKITTGLNRLQEIEAVHNGAVYTGIGGSGAFSGGEDGKGTSGNTDLEETVYAKWKSGEWSTDQALDFLTAIGKNEHDPGLQIASSIALDPTVFGSLGAGALEKLGVTGARLAASEAGTVIREAGTARKLNVLGKLGESDKVSSTVRWLGEHPYDALKSYGADGEVIGRSAWGTAAKTMRTIVDPLHAVGGNKALGEATVDLASEVTPRIMADAHGFGATFEALNLARDTSPSMFANMVEDSATYSGNIARKIIMRTHVATKLIQELGHELIGKGPGDILEGLVSHAPKDYVRLVKDEMVRVREMVWGEGERQNLADRLASLYGEKSSEEWLAATSKMGPETMSYLHAATYGRATKMFLSAIDKATIGIGVAAAKAAKLDRIVLLNRQTLTDVGAQGILKRIEDAATQAEKIAVAKEAQALYPELRYIGIDEANLGGSLDKFVRNLEKGVADGRLPAQLLDHEIAKLPQEMQDLYEKTKGVFGYGFRPEDDIAMGLVDTGEGYVQGFDAWVDHVAATGGKGYRGSVALAHNIAGMPILGQAVGHGLDFLEANARTLVSRVTTTSITEAAKSRFVVRAIERHGLTESQAKSIFEGVREAAQLRELTARGLSAKNMWEATRDLVPADLYQLGKFTQRDLLNLVVDSYEGDLRFVGLTQKFTGRAKAAFAHATGSNFAGQFAEDLYTKIRYKYNPIFQVQERIEPWVLNGQRGVNAALGTKLTETDRITARLYQKMRDTGLIRSSDVDQAEFSAMALQGTDMEQQLTRHADASRWQQLRDVSGAKRINLLRTLQRNMGKSVRAAFETHEPGSWDRIVQHYTDQAGHLISDDEAAVRYMAEQGFAGDVKVASVIEPGANFADFSKAISTAEWHKPASLGELKGLNLDFMASAMGFPLKDGAVVHDLGGLRAALADKSSGLTIDKVKEALELHGAHPDYIRRVENALDFHWDGFWRTAATKYNLTRKERAGLELMMSNAARVRGMTGVDYMSQVFSPNILVGKGADVESLESAVSILRAPAKGKGMPEDLITQMADAFHHHLDPSAQVTLLEAFQKDLPGVQRAAEAAGDLKTSLALGKTQMVWGAGDSDAFAKRILDYVEGKPPAAVYTPVEDATKGVADVRKVADDFMTKQGREAIARRTFTVDEDFSKRTSAAYEALPNPVGKVESTGPVTKVSQLDHASTELKLTPEGAKKVGIDAETYQAYKAFVQETAVQYKAIRKAGVKIEPGLGDPYKSSAEMVADVRDNKRLRVFAGSAEHPLLTDEQNVMFRGVHDYFAHAAEGFQFGPQGELNAAIKHSQMYGADARKAMLTETHGQNSVVNFSDTRAFPDRKPLDLADIAKLPGHEPKELYLGETMFGTPITHPAPKRIGDGLYRLPKHSRDQVEAFLDDWTQTFPNTPIPHIDAVDLRDEFGEGPGTLAATLNDEAIFLNRPTPNPLYGERPTGFGSEDAGMERAMFSEGHNAIPSLQGALYHELGHVIQYRSPVGSSAMGKFLYGDAAPGGMELLGGFDQAIKGGLKVSSYGSGDLHEAFAELFSLAVTPNAVIPPNLSNWVDELRSVLEADGIMVRRGPATQDLRSIAEVNKAAPGTVYATQKAALLPQDILDEFGTKFVGVGKGLESNPDVIRATQQFSKWSKEAIVDGLLKDEAVSPLVKRVTGIPTEAASPANQMHELLVNQVGHSMRQGAEDAFRLQYFAQERSFLERSINHPFFGIYPASYMWGKIAPEMAKFMARSPFGVRTGAASYAAGDFIKATAMQRELDPEFEKQMEALGHSPTAWFLGYMLPSVPWEVGAAAPTWARDLAGQALDNEDRVNAGLAPKSISLVNPLQRIADYINPLRPVSQVERPIGELGDVISGSKADQKAHGGPKTIPVIGAFPDQADHTAPTQGTGLGPVLTDEMTQLQQVLSGK